MVRVVFFQTRRNCSYRKEFTPSGIKFFPLREVAVVKRGAIEENQCLIEESPFDLRSFFSVLATR